MQHSPTLDGLPHDWARALQLEGFDEVAIAELLAAAYGASGATIVLPAQAGVFRAFRSTPLADVRIVVVGKDPYPDANDAQGVAFSTAPNRKPPLALRNVFTNLENDPDIAFARPSTGDLTTWTKRGVLLLNAALTFASGTGSARFTLWKPFLRATLRVVSKQGRPIPVVLFGREANNLSGWVSDPHAVVSAGHPTPRNKIATRFTLFSDAKPFSAADTYLRDRGEPAMNWRLP